MAYLGTPNLSEVGIVYRQALLQRISEAAAKLPEQGIGAEVNDFSIDELEDLLRRVGRIENR